MDSSARISPADADFPPHPGSPDMPRWNAGELIEPPRFSWARLTMFLGPGLVMGSSAIGGGEWLTGPMVTARYGGALLWLATLSILGQTLYNIEISRYALYTGEPIFTGKFRTLPGPRFWLLIYLVLDFGSVLPYLASNAAVPLYAVLYGQLPDTSLEADKQTIRVLACTIFALGFLPLIFGGKVYNSLKAVMAFKLVTVFGFLVFLALFFSTWSTWQEIGSGFFKFGTVPVKAPEDLNGNGKQDPGEAPHSSPVENVFGSMWQGRGFPAIEFSMFGILAAMAAISGNGGLTNTPISNYTRDQGWGMGYHVGAIPSVIGGRSIQLSHVGMVFRLTQESLARWRGWVRHVRREQMVLWAPACFLGLALPSMLSVQFLPRGTNLSEEQKWLAAGMTAGGVAGAVDARWGGRPSEPPAADVKELMQRGRAAAGHSRLGETFWYLTLGCGFLVLGTSMATTCDGVLRRWVDVFWTASARLRTLDTHYIGKLYFSMLCVLLVFGLVMLWSGNPTALLVLSTNVYNYALGFSCWHVLAVNLLLLPRELRPGWTARVGLVLSGVFFMIVAVITTAVTISAALEKSAGG